MQNRQIDKKSTKQVRIDAGLHQTLKVYAAESKMTIKELLEDYLSDLLAVDKPKVYKLIRKNTDSLRKRNENVTQIEQNQRLENRPKVYQEPTKTEQNHSATRAKNL